MAWVEFLRIVPTIIEFVQGLNLPPRSTVLATSGLIFGIAYSYKYFKTNDCTKNAVEFPENSEELMQLNDTSEVIGQISQETISEREPNLYQHITSAEHVIGSIKNIGEQQTVSIGNKYYSKDSQ